VPLEEINSPLTEQNLRSSFKGDITVKRRIESFRLVAYTLLAEVYRNKVDVSMDPDRRPHVFGPSDYRILSCIYLVPQNLSKDTNITAELELRGPSVISE
jgi:hypothetical protein